MKFDKDTIDGERELGKFLVESFVEFWMMDAPSLRPANDVIMAQATLWVDAAFADPDFADLDSGEWAWLLRSCRIYLAGLGRLLHPVPAWSSLCAYRKTQGVRESLQRHRDKPAASIAITQAENQSTDALLLKMLEDDLAAFMVARELGREAAMRARGANVVIACSKLAKNGFGPQISELFDRLEVCDGAKQDLSAIKERLNVE